MINFSELEGPFGIPVYHQELPMVESVALNWLIFTGAADDRNVGNDGIYHWFEHVPFRGTKQFPGGYSDTKPFMRYAGKNGAFTSLLCTCYWAFVPKEQCRAALNLITDLWSQPLLEDAAIEAEREIILKEITRKKASAHGKASYQMNGLLWPEHPFGHPVLGSEESLSGISTDTLRLAHRQGYDRSRAVLFVSGNISAIDTMHLLRSVSAVLPHRGLSPRRQPHTYGAVPEWQTGRTEIETEFESSLLYLLFPVPPTETPREKLVWSMISSIADMGGLNSPIYRIVRENRKLAYSTGSVNAIFTAGGYVGFMVDTRGKQLADAEQAIWDLLKDPYFRSIERFDEVKSSINHALRMQAISPSSFNETGISRLRSFGTVMSDRDRMALINSITYEEVMHLIDQVVPEVSRILTFKGTG